MTENTLQAVRAKQTALEARQAELAAENTKLATLIAELMNQTVTTITVDAVDIELRDGERYSGTVLDEDGTVLHHLVLMADKPDGRLTWQQATDWAKEVGGVLPTRQEQALLFANCKAHLDADWHWSSQTHESNASCAWNCLFSLGNQDSNAKSYAGCARAVRRLNP